MASLCRASIPNVSGVKLLHKTKIGLELAGLSKAAMEPNRDCISTGSRTTGHTA